MFGYSKFAGKRAKRDVISWFESFSHHNERSFIHHHECTLCLSKDREMFIANNQKNFYFIFKIIYNKA